MSPRRKHPPRQPPTLSVPPPDPPPRDPPLPPLPAPAALPPLPAFLVDVAGLPGPVVVPGWVHDRMHDTGQRHTHPTDPAAHRRRPPTWVPPGPADLPAAAARVVARTLARARR